MEVLGARTPEDEWLFLQLMYRTLFQMILIWVGRRNWLAGAQYGPNQQPVERKDAGLMDWEGMKERLSLRQLLSCALLAVDQGIIVVQKQMIGGRQKHPVEICQEL